MKLVTTPNDRFVAITELRQLVNMMISRNISVNRSVEAIDALGDVEFVDWPKAVAIMNESGADLSYKKSPWRDLESILSDGPCLLTAAGQGAVWVNQFLSEGQKISFPDKETTVEHILYEDALAIWTLIENNVIVTTFEGRDDVEKWWDGGLMTVAATPVSTSSSHEFSLRWFLSQIVRRRGLAAAICLTIFVVHALGLAIPLFFQAVVDKVLPSEAHITLTAISIGVAIVIVFEGLLKFLRDYMISHLAAKIDIITATKTFSHLVKLPLFFFQTNTAGVITNNIQQADEIREFITGRVLFSVIELTGVILFLPILAWFYSGLLAGLVFGTGCLMALVIWVLIGPYSKQLKALYQIEGERKTLLVETIHGVFTVKSLGLEQRRIKSWNDTSVLAVNAGFKMRKISAIGGALVEAIEQLGSVIVLVVGVFMVISNDLTVGALIAFRMLSSQVTDPLRGIAELVHEFQRVSLAVEMLAKIMREPKERIGGQSEKTAPDLPIIAFENVTFRFPNRQLPALKQISFEIWPGECIGIAGRSGSGKSTIARLIQGLYEPQSGYVRIQGEELRHWDLHALRNQTSVVLQDNFLFRGSVAENIGMATFNSSRHDIENAARLAGADEFISDLPNRYDEQIAENGSNLSGGQKQRIAIARALHRPHSILILDEATSALDVESEMALQQNMDEIIQERTTIIIAHRLSTLRHANRIMVIDNGELIDFGTMEELLEPNNGNALFKAMWEQQNGTARKSPVTEVCTRRTIAENDQTLCVETEF